MKLLEYLGEGLLSRSSKRYPIESIQSQYFCYAELYNGTINVNVQWKVYSTKSIQVCRLPWAREQDVFL